MDRMSVPRVGPTYFSGLPVLVSRHNGLTSLLNPKSWILPAAGCLPATNEEIARRIEDLDSGKVKPVSLETFRRKLSSAAE